jgi:hypothetical protein
MAKNPFLDNKKEEKPILKSQDVIPNMIRRAEEKMKLLGYERPDKEKKLSIVEKLNRDATFNFSGVFDPVPVIETVKRRYKVRCRRKPDRALRSLLGQAFNARYMSFDVPEIPVSEVYQEVSGIEQDQDYPSDDPGAHKEDELPFAVVSGFRKPADTQITVFKDTEAPVNVMISRSRRELAENKTMTIEMPYSNGTQVEKVEQQKPAKAKPMVQKDPGVLWSCEYELRWTDLGIDHYPRYIREVHCVQKNCWFGHFECRPKAFTVKVLKRWSDLCEIDTDQYLNMVYNKQESGDLNPVHDHDTIAANKEVDYEVPAELQEKWVWEEIGVNFCCECTSVKVKPFGNY